jgi:hypothetical protein
MGGQDLGASGTVQFVPNVNGAPQTPVQATVTTWTSTMLILTVPSGAASGLVTVTTEGKTNSGLPFIVTPGQMTIPFYWQRTRLRIRRRLLRCELPRITDRPLYFSG